MKKAMKIEQRRDPEGMVELVYFAIDPNGEWSRSEFPTSGITLDYNSIGDLIGIEVIGNLASEVVQQLAQILAGAAPTVGAALWASMR